MRMITNLRADSMTVEQLESVINEALEKAAKETGTEQERLLIIGTVCEQVLSERRASKRGMAQERSFIGKVALSERDLDIAEALKGQVRTLVTKVIEGESSGFCFDTTGDWSGGDIPHGAKFANVVNQFGIMTCYKSDTGASGIYINPQEPDDQQMKPIEIIQRDLDAKIDSTLKMRTYRKDQSHNI